MPYYKIKIDIEKVIEANNEGEALANWIDELGKNNETFITHIDENSDVVEVCPHCEAELKPKMIDIDGTNLEDRNICEECGYGYPI